MEESKLPMRPLPVTKEGVIAKVTPELTKLRYQDLLKVLVDLRADPNNLAAVQEKVKEAKKIQKAIDLLRKQETKPHYDNIESVNNGFNSFLEPLEGEINRLVKGLDTVNAQVKAEEKVRQAEVSRVSSVRAALESFINNTTRAISAARTDDEIVRVQKLIGTEKSRKGFYGDLMPELEKACDKLTPQINEQKDDIRKMANLSKKGAEAIIGGDLQTATEIKEQQEILDYKLTENVIRLQETAFEVSAAIEAPIVEVASQSIRGRRLWRWRVDDIKKLAKAHPELVKQEPDGDAIEALLSQKREDGSLKDKEELPYDGLTFYLKLGY